MDSRRYQAELSVLNRKLAPNLFRFIDMDTDSPYVVIAARTNQGNVYTLRIELENFPQCIPPVYVLKQLYTKNGDPMPSYSGAMHTLECKNGWTQICHEGESWTPNQSIYKVYIRCRLWLELYEAHLKTGHPMDYYLKHD